MKLEEFQKMMEECDREEIELLKDRMYLIKSKVNNVSIFDIIMKNNPPMKSFKLSIALQGLYEEIFGFEFFTDLKWLDYESTLNELQKEGQFNGNGINGLLWLIEGLDDKNLVKRLANRYGCLYRML